MGWKNVKEHYRIEHYVQVTEKGICIGSGYIHDIIVIGLDGEVKKHKTLAAVNADLVRYQEEMDADPDKLKALIDAPDTFTASLPVFTYDGGRIIEEKCEAYDWPNVTHAGHMMYENTYSKNRPTVVQWAIKNAELGVKWRQDRIEENRKQIMEFEAEVEVERGNLAMLQKELSK